MRTYLKNNEKPCSFNITETFGANFSPQNILMHYLIKHNKSKLSQIKKKPTLLRLKSQEASNLNLIKNANDSNIRSSLFSFEKPEIKRTPLLKTTL
jgi:hypothetical protein